MTESTCGLISKQLRETDSRSAARATRAAGRRKDGARARRARPSKVDARQGARVCGETQGLCEHWSALAHADAFSGIDENG